MESAFVCFYFLMGILYQTMIPIYIAFIKYAKTIFKKYTGEPLQIAVYYSIFKKLPTIFQQFFNGQLWQYLEAEKDENQIC